jgi:2,4-dienoyl-CoA reductase-like NADH-dependent reductase (Old Yellow Enzyme family)
MHSAEQVAGWKRIVEAVHRAGGKIFAQLWHVGRVSHPDFHDGALPVAPSALPVDGEAFTTRGRTRLVTPRALETAELPGIVAQFGAAAQNAKAAGFDGVELHGANGYLLDQFLRDGANSRSDGYGGSIENRARFPLEVADAVSAVWGPQRVGYKLSPYFSGYSMSDSNPVETFTFIAGELSKRGLLYLHVTEPVAMTRDPVTPRSRAAMPTSSPLACRFSPIPIFPRATAAMPPSTRRTRPRSMPARKRATSTIPPWHNRALRALVAPSPRHATPGGLSPLSGKPSGANGLNPG